MAGLRERNALQPTVSPDYNKNLPYLPHQPQGTYHPNAPQQPPEQQQRFASSPFGRNSMKKGTYIPPSGSAVDGDTHYTALPNMPAYNRDEEYHPGYGEAAAPPPPAPDSVTESETPSERRRFRKLIKRRPVPTR